ncbi:hypothetical protein [Haloferula sp.]|uniref:hypothetical protein n=1 Tax=Haloferula sp. TaxID=2497595 RepID=UPI0032A11955
MKEHRNQKNGESEKKKIEGFGMAHEWALEGRSDWAASILTASSMHGKSTKSLGIL